MNREMLNSSTVPDLVPILYPKTPQPIGAYPTATFQIPDLNGSSIYWDVDVLEFGTPNQYYTRARPGKSPKTASEFTVNRRTGAITFGGPHQASPTLRVMFRRMGLRHDPAPTKFGLALQSAFSMTTLQIGQHGPNDVTPPSEPHTTISAWANDRTPDQTLKQKIIKYGYTDLTNYESYCLLEEDPSFDIQGQWYGGASFGLLQVWPGNARDLLRNGIPSVEQRAALRELYDPLKEPGTKLFDPNIGVKFGAAADRAVDVLGEGAKWSYEDSCTSEPAVAPFNACTWSRYWARRFAAFNAGSDGKPRAYSDYGRWIVNNAGQFDPVANQNP